MDHSDHHQDHHHPAVDHAQHHGHHMDHAATQDYTALGQGEYEYGYDDQVPLPNEAHEAIDHSTMDHSAMDHGTMEHAPMDHSSMDHSGMHHGAMAHGDHENGHMTMYFHGGYNEVILFDFWRIDSIGGLLGSMVGCFILAMAYEGLKFLRELLIRKNFKIVRSCVSGEDDDKSRESPRTLETSMWSYGHFILTLLHLLQLSLAYFLMLIVMTFNTWLCLAVVLGATVGYFVFGWRRTLIMEESDHCQ